MSIPTEFQKKIIFAKYSNKLMALESRFTTFEKNRDKDNPESEYHKQMTALLAERDAEIAALG